MYYKQSSSIYYILCLNPIVYEFFNFFYKNFDRLTKRSKKVTDFKAVKHTR